MIFPNLIGETTIYICICTYIYSCLIALRSVRLQLPRNYQFLIDNNKNKEQSLVRIQLYDNKRQNNFSLV